MRRANAAAAPENHLRGGHTKSSEANQSKANPSKGVSQLDRFEYCVRYRRASWAYGEVRFYQSQAAADRLARKLTGGDNRWSPIVELRIERRAVATWEPA